MTLIYTKGQYWIGKCQSCQHSQGSIEKSVSLICTIDGKTEPTRPQWQCARYQYEPGSIE